ncbi:hypothetical protein LIN78_05700 [Leeia sp. TBRC 13508]|uniref:Uncharacterized protein n=1 Tax=Leeia speluncae TaxID=2884804 RepID=A0ABS8D4Z4_9NEIS|nr:hypothetical protein [Leeia speluncae]MCB6183041.1 hypothetical protein [Leeia speluncae]
MTTDESSEDLKVVCLAIENKRSLNTAFPLIGVSSMRKVVDELKLAITTWQVFFTIKEPTFIQSGLLFETLLLERRAKPD